MIQEIIGPLLKVKHTVIIGLSTTGGANNWFSKILNRKDDLINKLISKVQIELICKKCKADGMMTCECLKDLQPAHLSEKSDMTQLLIPNEQLFSQEVLGMIIGGNEGKIFNRAWVDAMLEKTRLTQLRGIQNMKMYTFIDPKGKSDGKKGPGASSYLAIVTIAITNTDNVIILGFDETASSTIVTQRPFLENYFSRFKTDNELCDLPHIVFVESNYCGLGPEIYSQIASSILPQTILYAMTPEKTGARTHFNKHEATQKAVLDIWDKKVWMIEDLKCCQRTRRDEIIQEFADQLIRLEFTDHGITGKKDGYHDDMAIAYIMISYWARRYNDERNDGNALSSSKTMASTETT